ncbi:hypothetical protein FOL47_003442 [Perkinsus chesapeaki]|uniref:Uncharacterized protein n=1 Tax=Perkinsus chesapeaki TaxID=330153 RepID=A0A7J6M831_PERCH|nr:hypothetical protein FOL47_003442 [Perkinsus chesapeaki]
MLLCSDICSWFKTKCQRLWQGASLRWRTYRRSEESEHRYFSNSSFASQRPDSEVFRLTPIFEEDTEDEDLTTDGGETDSLGLSVTPSIVPTPGANGEVARYFRSRSSGSLGSSPSRYGSLLELPSTASRLFDEEDEGSDEAENFGKGNGECCGRIIKDCKATNLLLVAEEYAEAEAS